MLGRLFGKKEESTRNSIKTWSKDEAEYIFLYGSQTGGAEIMAKSFFKSLIKEGKKVFMDELDNYTTYNKATHLIIFTSTYGAGGPPANATDFEDLFYDTQPINPMKFSVVAFGSTSFQDFCQFGVDIDSWLESSPDFERLLPLVKVNNQSQSDFRGWLSLWNRTNDTDVEIEVKNSTKKSGNIEEFKIESNQEISSDNTHLIKLRPKSELKFQSGDLLSVLTETEDNPRLYSIARIDGDILLSVKKHERGLCSSYMCGLKEGDVVKASIEENKTFHFVHDAPSVWMIGNGTGVAPFLGMMEENKTTKLRLIWGGRSESSFDLYQPFAQKAIDNGFMESYELALSRTGNKQYVQDILAQKQKDVSLAFDSGSVFMICGSMDMQNSVMEILDKITKKELNKSLSYFQDNGQLLKDCY